MSRPRRIMVIGPNGAGKTTLMTAMGYLSGPVTKTEAVCFTPECIDTPGEFLESPIFKNTFAEAFVVPAADRRGPQGPRHRRRDEGGHRGPQKPGPCQADADSGWRQGGIYGLLRDGGGRGGSQGLHQQIL